MRNGLLALAMVTVTGIAFAQTTPPPASGGGMPAQMGQAPQKRAASPAGTAQTQIGDTWIEITYSRPIKRGRDVFGSGADYGKLLLANGATVWRAGANQSTRLMTEVPLVIGEKTVPAGEYSLFIDLKSPTEWTLIVSSYGAKKNGRDDTPDTLWGSFGYTPDKDVARATMTVSNSQMSVDQLTWGFMDVTAKGGKLFLAWDTTHATVPFTVAK